MTAMHPITAPQTFDVARIRQDFPILSRLIRGKRLVVLASAGGNSPGAAGLPFLRGRGTAEKTSVHLHRFLSWASSAARLVLEPRWRCRVPRGRRRLQEMTDHWRGFSGWVGAFEWMGCVGFLPR